MATALFIVGLVVTLIGVGLVVMASFRTGNGGPQADAIDIADILKQFNELLEKLDKKFRVGVIVIAVGLALVGTGAYVAALDAKDAATSTALGH